MNTRVTHLLSFAFGAVALIIADQMYLRPFLDFSDAAISHNNAPAHAPLPLAMLTNRSCCEAVNQTITEPALPRQFRPQARRGLVVPVDFVYRMSDNSSSTIADAARTIKPTACVAFFGLVKSVSKPQLERYRTSLIRPLQKAGLRVVGFLHTFNFSGTTFHNPRNGEENESLDQRRGIDMLESLFPSADGGSFTTQVDAPEAADAFYGPVRRYLRSGNPWPRNNDTSVKYFLRQQYSLLRVTEMWANVTLTSEKQSTSAVPLKPVIRISRTLGKEQTILGHCDCVVTTRPDLLFGGRLHSRAIEFMCRRDVRSVDAALANGGSAVGAALPGNRKAAALQATLQKQSRHQDIMVKSIEHGGYNDRFAFGTPLASLRYGSRGLVLDRFVQSRHPPHAEKFLWLFLCENRVAVHLHPIYVARLRGAGYHLPYDGKSAPRWRTRDGSERRQRNEYSNSVATSFTTWSRVAAEAYAAEVRKGTSRSGLLLCPPVGVWSEDVEDN